MSLAALTSRYRLLLEGRWSTRSVTPLLLPLEQHGRVQSSTPLLGPLRALLPLHPSANRKSMNLPKYICSYPIKTKKTPILTRCEEQNIRFPLLQGRLRVASGLPPTGGRETGDNRDGEWVPRINLINNMTSLDHSRSGFIADLRIKAKEGNLACPHEIINRWSSLP